MQLKAGMILDGTVAGITGFGAFVDFADGASGMVHISEVAPVYVSDINEHLTIGQKVRVKVISVDDNGKVGLSIKKALPRNERGDTRPVSKKANPVGYEWKPRNNENASFEDMMSRFKQSSDEKIGNRRKNDGSPHRPRRSSKPEK